MKETLRFVKETVMNKKRWKHDSIGRVVPEADGRHGNL